MDFRDLKVWTSSMMLVEDIYRITKKFPKSEIYGLTNQMRRSAISVPSNIAEGNGRQHLKEYVNFLYIAQGSLLELITQIEVAKRLDYIDSNDQESLSNQCLLVNKMLRSLIKTLKEKSI
jgi:four helix bundle protein